MVWLLPAAFTACSRDSWWCDSAYWATESAGKIGTFLILIITCTFYTLREESKRKKLLVFLKSFLILGGVLTGIAFVNEHLTKEALAIARPSHLYIVQHRVPVFPVDSLYTLNKESRRALLQQLIQSDSLTYASFDQKILDHWVEESGYSFPSGHSFNAFLLALILTFSLYHSRNTLARRVYLLPLCWALLVAVSRVAVGAHSALDVSFGAALGLLVGHLFLYLDYTRAFIARKD